MTNKTYGYNSTIRYVLDHGVEFAGTRAVFDHTIEFTDWARKLRAYDVDYLFIPCKRGSSKTSLKYALHEAKWYMMATRDPEYIIQFGPIWDSMRDNEGLVNSNYGYQIVSNNGGEGWMTNAVRSILDEGHVTLRIANRDNVKLAHDTVCNNEIRIRINESHNVEVDVIARSIDLTFGLPYDMFAAQALVRMILRASNLSECVIDSLRFHVVNLHIYERDLNRFESLASDPAKFENYYLVDFDKTPYSGAEINIENLRPLCIAVRSHENCDVIDEVFEYVSVSEARECMSDSEFKRLSEMINSDLHTRKAVSIDKDNRLIYFRQLKNDGSMTIIRVK